MNPITVRMNGPSGETVTEIADFRGNGGERQSFRLRVPGGLTTVSLVFLPGSRFDLEGLTFRS